MSNYSVAEEKSSKRSNGLLRELNQDEAIKLEQSLAMNSTQKKLGNLYFINQQGVDNRRSLFEHMKQDHTQKQMSEASIAVEQDLDDDSLQIDKSHQFSSKQLKKSTQKLLSQQNRKRSYNSHKNINHEDQQLDQEPDSPFFSNKSLTKPIQDKKFEADTFEELTKDKSLVENNQAGSFQRSPYLINQNSYSSSQGIDLNTAGRKSAKLKRQTLIAMKIKGAGLQTNQGMPKTPETYLKSQMNIIQNSGQGHMQYANQKQMNKTREIDQVYSLGGLIIDDDPLIETKRKQHLIILTYMKRFLNQLLRRLSYKKLELVTIQHLQMIGDLSIPKSTFMSLVEKNLRKDSEKLDILSRRRALYNEKETEEIHNCSQNLSKISKQSHFLYWMISQVPIILPQSLFLILLEGLLLSILLFYLLFTPLKASFEFTFDEQPTFQLLAYKIPVFAFLFDIGVGFHTGYYELGRVVLSRKLIAKRYFLKKFWIDAFGTLMMFLNTFVIFSTYLDIFNLILRINQMKMKIQKINEHFRVQNKYPAIYEMVKLTMILLFMSHVCGCGFHLIGNYSSQQWAKEKQVGSNVAGYQSNWISYQDLDDSDWIVRYVFSIYFSVITMVTVGFGDIFPVNIYEKMYVIGMTIVSCALFAYCVNAISSLFSQMSQKSQIFKQKQYDLLNYMNQKNITTQTQTKIMKYLDYLEEESDQNTAKGEQVISQFPIELREQVMREYFVKILVSVPILRLNFSASFLNSISLKMKEKRLGPGEQILSKSGHLEALQFITKGNIEYSMNDGEHQRSICQVKSDNTVIDFRLFVTGLKSSVSISSSTMTNIAYITYSDFLDELKKYHKDFEQFCYLRDQFLNDGRYEKTCPSCNQYGHEIDDCPQIHYCINKSIFSKKVFYSAKQKRDKNPNGRWIDRRTSWKTQYEDIRNDLKYIRWAYVIDQHNLYNEVDIEFEVKTDESDKSFFLRCPKLRYQKIQATQVNLLTTKQGLDEIVEEAESKQSLSFSDNESDNQTDYSDSFNKFQKSYRQDDTLNQAGKLVQPNLIDDEQKDILSPKGWEEPGQSVSSIMNEFDVPLDTAKVTKPNEDIPNLFNQNNNNNNSTNINAIFGGGQALKSDSNIIRQDSTKQKLGTFVWQNGAKKLSMTDVNDKESTRQNRQHSRHFTGRSLAGIERTQTGKNTFLQCQNPSSSLSNSIQLGNQGEADLFNSVPLNNILSNNFNQLQGGGSGGMENIKELDNLVNKLKKQCLKLMNKDLLYIPTVSRDDATRLGSYSKNSRNNNRNNTNLSNTNTVVKSDKASRDIKAIKVDRFPPLKERTRIRYQTVMHPSPHIFGKLQFHSDSIKEYLVYYPKGNSSNIIKIYKKIQYFNNYQAFTKTMKGKQSIHSDQLSSYQEPKIEKPNPQIQKILKYRHSKHSQMSSMDYK